MPSIRRVIGIIEDDASFSKGIATLLDTLGFATEMYSSAEDYIARASASEASCLLLDIDLGGMSGIELGRRLAASCSKPPIIFMTALSDDETYKHAVATGCVALLRKPFRAELLIEALDRSAA